MKILKQLCFSAVLSFIISFLPVAGFGQAPVLFFSDIVSGPAAGGENNKGAFVTVIGRHFGEQQGNGYVSIGGGRAGAYKSWADDKIIFQLGHDAKTGNITVTTSGGTSNGLPFVERPGNIYFVSARATNDPGRGDWLDPWRSPESFYKNMKPGDICYIREGIYSERYGAPNERANIGIGDEAPDGMANNEIAWVAYPGDTVRFEAQALKANILFGYKKNYYVFAGLSLWASESCIVFIGGNHRFVNNSCEGLKAHGYASIHPSGGSGSKIYGNLIYGAQSKNKLDHPIYVAYGTDNLDIGWNRLFDNDVAEGPVISINTDNAGVAHYTFENILIHDNLIDCRGSSAPLRAIGIVATDTGSSIYIYNNLIIGGGDTVLYQYSARSYIYNNTIYDSSGSAALLLETVRDGANYYRPDGADVINNIFFNRTGAFYVMIKDESAMGNVKISNNCYFGNGGGPVKDVYAVNADPWFVDVNSGDFRLQAASPCVDAGDPEAVAVAGRDFNGNPRPFGAAVDIGAYEYTLQPAVSVAPGTSTPAAQASPLLPGDIMRVVGSSAGKGAVNPDRGESAKIYFRGSETGEFELRIFNVAGELVWQDRQTNAQEGFFEWTPATAASGIYVAHIKGPGINTSRKIAVIR